MEATATVLERSIRTAWLEDLPQVLRIERESFDKHWDLFNFKASLEDVFLVYEKAGEIIGFVVACCCRLAKRGMILRVAVDPAHRRRGVAIALLQEAFERLEERDVQDVDLDVDVVKSGALRLYEKVGFKIVEILTLDPEGDESFYIMRKRLH
ncbi:MAG: GNAT family N-acetyltransferase [Deltaproteobacteria bacterium]|nr:GNAT family N-acetyltransferase [Deltaproteobacteria bacterium]